MLWRDTKNLWSGTEMKIWLRTGKLLIVECILLIIAREKL